MSKRQQIILIVRQENWPVALMALRKAMLSDVDKSGMMVAVPKGVSFFIRKTSVGYSVNEQEPTP